jgi:hypothetical protein
MKISKEATNGYEDNDIEVDGIVVRVCPTGSGEYLDFMVKSSANDVLNPDISDLVLVELKEVTKPTKIGISLPVAKQDYYTDAHIEMSLMMLNGSIQPKPGYDISISTIASYKLWLDRSKRSVTIRTDDVDTGDIEIDSNIFAVMDEYAGIRYYGLTLPNLHIVELDAEDFTEEPKESPEDEDEDESNAIDDNEKDESNKIDVKVSEAVAILYDAVSTSYIEEHFAVVDEKFTSLVESDIVYNYTVKMLEYNKLPETIYDREDI